VQKQPVTINFAQGLNTKTDPWQLPIGQFEQLKNAFFQKGGLLKKRPGYGYISLDTPPSTYITTLNGNLTAIGTSINAYSPELAQWISRGKIQPCSLSVLPLIRNNLNQTQVDTAIANNLVLTVYTEINGLVSTYKYAVADATTGQNIVVPTAIPPYAFGTVAGAPRAFVVGGSFLIVCPVTVSGSTYLQYVAVPTLNLAAPSAPQQVTSDIYAAIPGTPGGWDGVAVNSGGTGQLVVAYNSTTGGQGIHVATLSAGQIAANSASSVIRSFTNSAYKAGVLSVCVDQTSSPNIYYVSFWNPTTTNAYTLGVYTSFGAITQQFAPQETFTSVTLNNMTSAALNASCTIFADVANTYGYNSTIVSDFIDAVTVSSAGAVGTPYVAVRSTGLASKAFVVNSTVYFLASYTSPFQPTYFLINGTASTAAAPIITAKLAYQNGGGYLANGLPGVSISGEAARLGYLFKDDVDALSTENVSQQTVIGGIYSQTGINLITFTIGTESIQTVEAANNLQISGGYLGQYDGYLPVEHNFFLFPDSVEATWTEDSIKTPTGTASNGSTTITLSSGTGVYPGMTIADTTNSTYIPAGTVILTVSGTTVVMSAAATHAISGDSLSIQGNVWAQPDAATNTDAYYYQVTYEWTDNQGLAYRSTPSIPIAVTTTMSAKRGIISINVPTLRLTAKTANPVKIVVYRWSVENQTYYQATSILYPVLNSTTTDYVTWVDTQTDAEIVGSNILYTTGGTAPDFNAPATNLMTEFDNRLWTIDAENPNTARPSKTLIPNAPVEMSPGFSIYVSPTTGTTKSLGPITAHFPLDDKLIFFFRDGMCYINGTGPDNLGTTAAGSPLGNYSQPTYISSTVGCTNPNSIVLTPDGLMFQSDKGIWLLDHDLGTDYIGAAVEDFNQFAVTSAQAIPSTNYVLFTLDGTAQFLMFDYYYKQWGTFEGVNGAASCIYRNLHTVLDVYGNVSQQTPSAYLDGGTPVLMSFVLGWINLATLQGYQRIYDFYFLMKYLSPHFINCQIAYDYNYSALDSVLLKPQNFSPPTPSPFGVPTPVGSPGQLEQWRVHAKRQLCQSFQLSVQEIWDPTLSPIPGAGFTMSGLTARVGLKSATRPIPGSQSGGFG
jgi:hypothetical protein